jgi:ATP-binding cassette, subfamily C, bacterial PrsD
LDMALVLYEGKSIAFGSCQEVFARVGASKAKGAPARPQPRAAPNSAPRAVAPESV